MHFRSWLMRLRHYNMKKVLAIVIAIILDILTLLIGIPVTIINLFSGNFAGAGIAFLVMIVLLIVFPVIGGIIAKDRPVKINEKNTVYVEGFEENLLSLKEVKRIASKYQYGFYLGKTARAILNQTALVEQKINKAREAVNNRFEANSITWDRYMGVVDAAADTAVGNLDMMARRISVLDEKEYSNLTNPLKQLTKKDSLNSGRLDFYKENKECIERGIHDNEEMFNRLDTLSLELSQSADSNTKTDAVINDIEEITGQVKYYK